MNIRKWKKKAKKCFGEGNVKVWWEDNKLRAATRISKNLDWDYWGLPRHYDLWGAFKSRFQQTLKANNQMKVSK